MTAEVFFTPDRKSAKVRIGTSLFDAGRRARVMIRSRCGGKASCLMCKVIVENQAGLSPPNLNEKLKLGSLLDQNYRLACQAKVIGPLTAEIPEDPLKAAIRLQLERQREERNDPDR